jgi:hypothetical protein
LTWSHRFAERVSPQPVFRRVRKRAMKEDAKAEARMTGIAR